MYEQRTAGLRQELEAMRAAASQFERLHREAAAEVERLREAQGLEQGQAHMLLKQGAALKRDNHLLKVHSLVTKATYLVTKATCLVTNATCCVAQTCCSSRTHGVSVCVKSPGKFCILTCINCFC